LLALLFLGLGDGNGEVLERQLGSVMNSVYGLWPMRGSAMVTR